MMHLSVIKIFFFIYNFSINNNVFSLIHYYLLYRYLHFSRTKNNYYNNSNYISKKT